MINGGFFSNMVSGGDNGHNHFQTFRTDSEELLDNWITSEESHKFNSSSMVHRTPQAMGRNVVEGGVHANDLQLEKAWFHSTRPMTRSRSSELKRNYSTLQNFQTSVSMETTQNVSGLHVNNPKQETENPNEVLEGSYCNILNHLATFVSTQHSSLPTFGEKLETEDGSFEVYGEQEVLLGDTSLDQISQRTYLDLSNAHVNNGHRILQAVNGSVGLEFEGLDAVKDPIGNTTCESSIHTCVWNNESGDGDGVTNYMTVAVNRVLQENYMTIADDQRPKERLVRCGSATSADPVDEGEAKKKRRVERSRKMVEAKERVLTPAVSSDMQSIVKQCENLEKEVRSLKLNLAFMNRKDSEQTKQLEELQIHHEELTNEKERMLEEIERILAARRKM